MMIDHHTHSSTFSFDGRQTVVELLQSAQKIGLDGVCLAEHYEKDVSYVAGEEAVFDLDAYQQRVFAARENAQSAGLLLLYGIELGYLPHLDDHFARIALRHPFDAIILSLHLLDGEDPYSDRDIYLRGRSYVYGRYLEQLTEMTTACPDFDILGHVDYISRYATWPDRKIRWYEQPDRFDALFRTLIDAGKTLELNTATVRTLLQAGYPQLEAWPDTDLFRRFRELGGEHVCLSSDAHDALQVGSLLAEGRQYLHQLGFRFVTHYVARHPVMTSL